MAIEGIPLKALLFRAISVWNMGKLWLEDNWIDLRVADSYFQTYIVAFTSNYWVECSTQRKSLRVLWGGAMLTGWPCVFQKHESRAYKSKQTSLKATISKSWIVGGSINDQNISESWMLKYVEIILKLCFHHPRHGFPHGFPAIFPSTQCDGSSARPRHSGHRTAEGLTGAVGSPARLLCSKMGMPKNGWL